MKSIFNGRIAHLLLVVLFIGMGFNPVIAADVCDKKPWLAKCSNPGDDDPVGVMTPTFNTAYWSGPYITEEAPAGDAMAPRACGCGGSGGTNPQGGVAYVCHQFGPMENLVQIDLRDLIYQPEGRGASEYCEWLYEGTLVFNVWPGDDRDDSISRSYYYSMDPTWNDGPCIDEQSTCLIKVYTQAYFEEGPIGCEGTKCGRLVELEGWGQASHYGKVDGVYEFNPFRAIQDIYIDDMTITFRGVRRDKRVARCNYEFAEGSRPVFKTIPYGEVNCAAQ